MENVVATNIYRQGRFAHVEAPILRISMFTSSPASGDAELVLFLSLFALVTYRTLETSYLDGLRFLLIETFCFIFRSAECFRVIAAYVLAFEPNSIS